MESISPLIHNVHQPFIIHQCGMSHWKPFKVRLLEMHHRVRSTPLFPMGKAALHFGKGRGCVPDLATVTVEGDSLQSLNYLNFDLAQCRTYEAINRFAVQSKETEHLKMSHFHLGDLKTLLWYLMVCTTMRAFQIWRKQCYWPHWCHLASVSLMAPDTVLYEDGRLFAWIKLV